MGPAAWFIAIINSCCVAGELRESQDCFPGEKSGAEATGFQPSDKLYHSLLPSLLDSL